jgi:hypothetical protein
VLFSTCSTDHGKGRQPYQGKADAIAVHVPDLSQVFMVPINYCPPYMGFLRLESPRNNRHVAFVSPPTTSSSVGFTTLSNELMSKPSRTQVNRALSASPLRGSAIATV